METTRLEVVIDGIIRSSSATSSPTEGATDGSPSAAIVGAAIPHPSATRETQQQNSQNKWMKDIKKGQMGKIRIKGRDETENPISELCS